MLKIIKSRLYSTLKSWLNLIERENYFAPDAKCELHPTSKFTAVSFSGSVLVNEYSVIEKTKLAGSITIDTSVLLSNTVIEGEVKIGSYSKIVGGVELYGNIEIGRNTTINGHNTDLRASINKIVIGNFCSIARNVTFQEFNHDHRRLTTYFIHRNLEERNVMLDIVSKGDIEIGHDVWIGTHSVILSGAKIGIGAVIAANSVVVGDIPPYAIASGSPAKVIKYRFNQDVIDSLLESKWWNKPHSEILYLFEQFGIK